MKSAEIRTELHTVISGKKTDEEKKIELMRLLILSVLAVADKS